MFSYFVPDKRDDDRAFCFCRSHAEKYVIIDFYFSRLNDNIRTELMQGKVRDNICFVLSDALREEKLKRF
jgi:hypothetical protein